jgi:hypothetical protein
MKKLILTLTGFALALCFALWSGCKDDCPPCGDAYKTIPQEMKDWALFEDGSWWVYRLTEDTTVFDTVRVSPNSKRFFRSNGTCGDNNPHAISCSETITYGLQHSNKTYFANPFNSNLTVYDEINLYYPHGGGVFLSYKNGKAPSNAGVIFGMPIIIDEKYSFHCLSDTLEKFVFMNKEFINVFITKNCYNIPSTNDYPETMQEIYWSKNVGLIKIRLINAQKKTNSWELINYEVKQ